MHVSIGPILDTDQWRVARGAHTVDCATEAEARHLASALAVGGCQIVGTIFHEPRDAEDDFLESISELAAERVSDLTIAELKEKLAKGECDEILDEIEMAEKAGADRVGALAAIEARREDISG